MTPRPTGINIRFLGQAIARARESKAITLRQLQHRCGVSQAEISLIETGKINDPRFSTIVRIARELDLSLEQLGRTVRRSR